MNPTRFPKKEKLKKSKEITALFEKGKWKSKGNLRIILLKSHPEIEFTNTKFGVSVSKRYFKKAVDRNRIKRLLREAYRLNKDSFHQAFGDKTLSMIFWTSQEMPTHFQQVEAEFLSFCSSIK